MSISCLAISFLGFVDPMHEMSLATSLIDAVVEEASRRPDAKVTRVAVRIGEWSGVDVESFRFCFEVLAAESEIAGAALEIEFREKATDLDVAFLELENT